MPFAATTDGIDETVSADDTTGEASIEEGYGDQVDVDEAESSDPGPDAGISEDEPDPAVAQRRGARKSHED